LIALKKAGVSDAVMEAMTEAEAPAPAATTGNVGVQAQPTSPLTGVDAPSGMGVNQEIVTYDGSTFRITSVNGIPPNVVETKPNGQVITSVLMTDVRVISVPNNKDPSYADRVNAVLRIHAESHGPTSSPAASPGNPGASSPVPGTTSGLLPAGSSGPTASPARFDDANHTIRVVRPEGVMVTFVENDVDIAGIQSQSYILQHQKDAAGRFLEHSIAHPNAAGGSLSGGGEEFLRERGGIVYDSGIKTEQEMQVSHQVLLAKQLSQVVVDAVAPAPDCWL